jgi:hypothetical protein
MNKNDVSQRVLQNGESLSLNKFEWDEKKMTFSSKENGLVIDFRDVGVCTFKTGSDCTFNTGSYCTFNTGWGCTFDTGSHCTFNTGWNCTFKTGSYCTFKTGSDCTFKTGSYCTFNTGSYCTFKTGSYCTFDTCSYCTFNTGWDCMFDTGCTCTFDTYKYTYIHNNAQSNVVIIRDSGTKTIYDLDTLPKQFLQLTINNVIAKDYKEVELIDDSFMVKLSSNHTKDNITFYLAQYVIDYFENTDKKVYIAQDGEYFAHGDTLESAIKNVIFKKQYDLGAEDNAKRVVASGKVTMDDYRLLTGSCDTGTKHHLDEYNIPYDTVWTIEETIDFIKKTNAYRADIFIENLKKVGWKK